ncbi:histidine phosphatase family protein [Streptococcus pluranimalium]|uniref:histidine phosphatase family protein n=1 Tax=Streptococcus pluranimalium TaxID=82348 RepID=UPI0039FCC74E
MKYIITVQHPQSQHHVNGMVGSWTDWHLTEKGLSQAQAIANHLSEVIPSDCSLAIYSSDLKRTKETTQIIEKSFDVKPMYLKSLRERNLGKCCGKSVKWLKENMEKEEFTIDDQLFSDAESRRDVWERLIPTYHSIMQAEEEWIIIVSHGDLLAVWNAMFLNLSVEFLNQADIFGYAGGISYMYVDKKGKHIIKQVSDLSQLEND